MAGIGIIMSWLLAIHTNTLRTTPDKCSGPEQKDRATQAIQTGVPALMIGLQAGLY